MIDFICEGEGKGGGEKELNLYLPKQKSHQKVPKPENQDITLKAR